MPRAFKILIAASALVLTTSCFSLPPLFSQDSGVTPSAGTEQASDASACPTQAPVAQIVPCKCPECQDVLHAVSLFSASEINGEEAAALHDYSITAQGFSAGHILFAGLQRNAPFSLHTSPPVVALGRNVASLVNPETISDLVEPIKWRIYVPGDENRTEIACSDDVSLYWQEVYADLKATAPDQDVFAYSAPASEVCFMPAGTTTTELAEDADRSSVWIDVAVFDTGNGTYGIYRFGPGPGQSGGNNACHTVCDPIKCNSPLGCLVQSVCNTVCS